MTEPIKLKLNILPSPYSGIEHGSNTVFKMNYSDSLQKISGVEDFEGMIDWDTDSGIFFVNPRYDEAEFSEIYKSLSLKTGTFVKKIASWPTEFLIRNWKTSNFLKLPIVKILDLFLSPLVHPPLPTNSFNGGNILDVGCGDGFHLRCFEAYRCNLFGTEIHPGYKEILSNSIPPIRYWLKTFTDIDWQKESGWESFDLIIFQSVFYRLNDPLEAHKLAWKLLRPGGSILRIEPFCPTIESVKFFNKFNFPQGFTFIQNPEKYIQKIKNITPDAEINYKIFYGRSRKHTTGKELNILSALWDIMRRLFLTVMKEEPWFIRLDIHKPSHGNCQSDVYDNKTS